jgi:hypothetical protein
MGPRRSLKRTDNGLALPLPRSLRFTIDASLSAGEQTLLAGERQEQVEALADAGRGSALFSTD